MRPAPRTVIVCGAGIGGLTAALALLRAGWRVRVYEQARALRQVGAGISLSPGAAAGLASLGLGPGLLAASLPVSRLVFVHHRTGAVLSESSAGEPGAGDPGLGVARHIHRADLHALLLAAVRAADPQALVLGKRLVRVEQPDGVEAHFSDGDRAHAELLIGADGARSAVRSQLFADAAPVFAGQVAYRCLIARAAAAPFLAAGAAVVSIGAGRVFHRYPVRGGDWLNVVGIARSNAWPHEGWNTPATMQEFLAAYADFHDDVTGLIRLAAGPDLVKWGLFLRPPLARWSVGRSVLLGDAAHPILPFLGLGAALAIEDAIVLVRAFEATDGWQRALGCYQATRFERVDAVRVKSLRQGELIQASGADERTLAQAPAGEKALFDFDPCREPLRHDAHG